MKIAVLVGDTLVSEQRFTKKNPSFVFLIMDYGKVFYVDTALGRLYVADSKLKSLGKGHRKVIQRLMSE